MKIISAQNMPGSHTDIEHLRLLMKTFGVGMWHLDVSTDVLTVDELWLEIMRWAEKKLPADLKNWRREMVHHDDIGELMDKLQAIYEARVGIFVSEYRLVRPDKLCVWLHEKVAVTKRDKDGNPLVVTGIVQDITESRQEEALRKSRNEQLEYVAEIAGLGSWEWDLVADYISYNDAYRTMLGYAPGDMNGSLAEVGARIVHPQDVRALREGLLQYIKTNRGVFTMNKRVKKSDGEYIWVKNIASIVERDVEGKPLRLRGGVLNIDKEVRAEKLLQEAMQEIKRQNERLENRVETATKQLENSAQTVIAMFNANPQINILFNERFEVIDCNPKALECFGFSGKEEFIANFVDFIDKSFPEYQPEGQKSGFVNDKLTHVLERNYDEHDITLLINSKEVTLHVILKAVPYNGTSAVIAYMNERNETDERMRLMLDSIPLACILIDENLNIVDCNSAAIQLTGLLNKKTFMEKYQEVLPEWQPDASNSLQKLTEKRLQTFRRGKTDFYFQYRLLSGEAVPTHIAMERILWHGKLMVVAYCHDLRKLRETERERDEKNRLLQAVNEAAKLLLQTNPSNFYYNIRKSMQILGSCAGADKVSIWENSLINGKVYATRVAGWICDHPYNEDKTGLRIDYESFLPEWANLDDNLPDLDKPMAMYNQTTRNFQILLESGSLLLIPLYNEGEFWGFIGFSHPDNEHTFSKMERDILRSGGTMMASAIKKIRVTESLVSTKNQLQQQAKLLKIANDAAALLLDKSEGDLGPAVQKALQMIGEGVEANRVYVWKTNFDSDRITCTQTADWLDIDEKMPEDTPFTDVPFDEYFPHWQNMGDKNIIINGSSEGLPLSYYHKLPGMRKVLSMLVLRISVNDTPWGFIGFDNCEEERTFSDSIIEILESSSMMIVSAIVRNEISENLMHIERIAAKDSLTGLNNRTSFLKCAQKAFHEHKDAQKELAVMFFDVDHFKKINDRYGHPFGDRVLIRFAEIIQNNIRPLDFSCRYGGEEFVVMLTNSGSASAQAVGRRIMNAIRDMLFEDYPDFSFTVSIGICADAIEADDTVEDFIARSDQALYQAKESGRNRIVVHGVG